MEKYISLKRLGKPEDIAPIVAFLSSDLSFYITGQVIGVSDGLTMV
jgi:NAD(P)-dependent dehydrogenase (short-subunit alcohol dehydrogenase family)